MAERMLRVAAPTANDGALVSEATGPRLNRSSGGSREVKTPGIIGDVLRSPGIALDAATRSFAEPQLGRDLSVVRIHADAGAAGAAKAVQARAFTMGSNIVFGSGEYSPGTMEGKQLLGHELTHVVQQMEGGAPALQRQPAPQTSTLPDPDPSPPDPGYQESPWAPSYRVRVVAHASPRWKGATSDKEADELNLQLSQRRADEVAQEVERMMAKHLPAGSTVNVQTSVDMQEDTVRVEEEAHGSRDTLKESGGNRTDNAQIRRRVDVFVSSNQVVSGSGGASRPPLHSPTASKFWHVSVDLSAGGSAGGAAYLLSMTLTNDKTGESMHGRVWSVGGGPKASIGAAYSLSDATGFMTAEPMNFEDFEGQWVTYTSGGVSVFIGYSWSYVTFRGLRTDPTDINVSGATTGTAGIGGSITSGVFHYEGTPAYPPTSVPIKDTNTTEVPYIRTEQGEDKYSVLFETGIDKTNSTEKALLDSFVASVVAARH